MGQSDPIKVNTTIAATGSNLFNEVRGATSSGGFSFGSGSIRTLTINDAHAIAELPSISTTAPVTTGTVQLNYAARNWSTLVTGTTPDYFAVGSWKMESGTTFTESDLRSAARVVVLGSITARNLFNDEDPIGKTIRITNRPFLVTGVLMAKGQSLTGCDQDDNSLISITISEMQITCNPFPASIL